MTKFLLVLCLLSCMIVGGWCGSAAASGRPSKPKPYNAYVTYMLSSGPSVFVVNSTNTTAKYTAGASTTANYLVSDSDYFYLSTPAGIKVLFKSSFLASKTYSPKSTPTAMGIDSTRTTNTYSLQLYYTVLPAQLRLYKVYVSGYSESGGDYAILDGVNRFAVDKAQHRVFALVNNIIFLVDSEGSASTFALNVSTPGVASSEDLDIPMMFDASTQILLWGATRGGIGPIICGINVTQNNPKVFTILQGYDFAQVGYTSNGTIYGLSLSGSDTSLWSCNVTDCVPSTITDLKVKPSLTANFEYANNTLDFIDDRSTVIRYSQGTYKPIFTSPKTLGAFTINTVSVPRNFQYYFFTLSDVGKLFQTSGTTVTQLEAPFSAYSIGSSYYDQDTSKYSIAYGTYNLYYSNGDGTIHVWDSYYDIVYPTNNTGLTNAYALTAAYFNQTSQMALFAADTSDNKIKMSFIYNNIGSLSFKDVATFTRQPNAIYYDYYENAVFFDSTDGIMKKRISSSDAATLVVPTSDTVIGICKNVTHVHWLARNTQKLYYVSLSAPSTVYEVPLPASVTANPLNNGLFCYYPAVAVTGDSSDSSIEDSQHHTDNAATTAHTPSILLLCFIVALLELFL